MASAMLLPGTGGNPPAPSVQSLNIAVRWVVVPSVYVTVAVPPAPALPALVALPSSPIVDACAGAASGMVCPAASMLSSVATGTSGQVYPIPFAVTVPPGVTPCAASACAEELQPPPSKVAASVSVSSAMPAVV